MLDDNTKKWQGAREYKQQTCARSMVGIPRVYARVFPAIVAAFYGGYNEEILLAREEHLRLDNCFS